MQSKGLQESTMKPEEQCSFSKPFVFVSTVIEKEKTCIDSKNFAFNYTEQQLLTTSSNDINYQEIM